MQTVFLKTIYSNHTIYNQLLKQKDIFKIY